MNERSAGIGVYPVDDQQIRLSWKRLRDFVEYSADTFFIHDMEGQVIDVNQAACDSLGYERSELIGIHIANIEQTIPKGSLEGIWNRMTPEVPITVEGIHRRKDGTLLPVEVRLGLFGEEGQYLMCASCRDISERKREEDAKEKLLEALKKARDEAYQASQAKSLFLANMSHELRTPLNAIIGYTELIQEELYDSPPEDLQNDLDKIHHASQHLLKMIQGILDLSKIEAGKYELFPQTFELLPLLQETANFSRILAEKNNNRLELQDGLQLRELTTDRTKLRQVLLNLLSNACKFTHNGTIKLTVEQDHPIQPEWLIFSVQDTGIGIPSEQLEHLFQPFTQTETSSKNSEGTGLGLMLSRQLCRLMGGDLTAESQVDVGSTFTIRLPVAHQLASIPIQQRESTPTEVDGEKLPIQRLLYINTTNKSEQPIAAATAIEELGLRVANTKRKGFAFQKALRPEVLLVDGLFTPGKNWNPFKELQEKQELFPSLTFASISSSENTNGYLLPIQEIYALSSAPLQLSNLLTKYQKSNGVSRFITLSGQSLSKQLQDRPLQENWEFYEYSGTTALPLRPNEGPELILLELSAEITAVHKLLKLFAKGKLSLTTPVILLVPDLPAEVQMQWTDRLHEAICSTAPPLQSQVQKICRISKARAFKDK